MQRGSGDGPPVACLPNGLEIAFQSRVEMQHFYRDIFREEVYLGGHLHLPPEAVVFDVGANIGIFTLFTALRSPGARIWSFEPAPPLFELLSRNAGRYAPRARLLHRGVAERPGTAELRFYPASSGMSSFHPDLDEERQALRVVVENEAREGDEAARALLDGPLEDYLDERLESVTFRCPLTTLSQVIADDGVERIDLLKVDVQKSELAVLEGIAEADWPRIRQVAVEVHDLDDRLVHLTDLLEAHGYRVEVEQEALYRGSDIYLLYGRRTDRQASRGARLKEAAAPPRTLLAWSADTPAGLERRTQALGRWLEERAAGTAAPAETAGIVAALGATLQSAPPARRHRRAAVVGDAGDAARALAGEAPRRLVESTTDGEQPAVAFLFPGLGNHHAGMVADLLGSEPLLRRDVLESCDILAPVLGTDLREHFEGLAGAGPRRSGPDLRQMLGRGGTDPVGIGILRETRLAQPALFAVELALARAWMRWGIRPETMVGYSLGELVAACVAGVFTHEDALRLVAERARLIDALPAGAMLAVSLPVEELRPRLPPDLSVTAYVGPEVTVIGGPVEPVAELERELSTGGTACRRLETSHAFHCEMLRSAAGPFAAAVTAVPRRPPKIPWLSNVTGTRITAEQAMDPAYWGEHIVRPVLFSQAVDELWRHPRRAFLEVGPGGTLGAWALQHPAAGRHATDPVVLASLPHGFDAQMDHDVILRSLGRLWTAGAPVDWDGFHLGRSRHLVELPAEFLAQDGDAEKEPRAATAVARPAPAATAGPLEVKLADLWCKVLDRPKVGRHEDFFEIGGDSLRAMRLIAACHSELGAALTLRNLFDAPTLAALAELLAAADAAGPALRNPPRSGSTGC